MTTATPSVAQSQLADALTQVRMSRHHRDCACHMYRGLYCNAEEMRWCYQVDRLLTTIQQASF